MNSADPSELFTLLQEKAKQDTAVVAVLRRSAAYDPGLYPPAFPHIEPHVAGMSRWRRSATYLAVACWALAQRREEGIGLELPLAVKKLQGDSDKASKNIEARFTALLDADSDELQWRLRHLTSQLAAAGIAVDWPSLLKDLWNWQTENRWVQTRWARQFWSDPSGKANPPANATSPA